MYKDTLCRGIYMSVNTISIHPHVHRIRNAKSKVAAANKPPLSDLPVRRALASGRPSVESMEYSIQYTQYDPYCIAQGTCFAIRTTKFSVPRDCVPNPSCIVHASSSARFISEQRRFIQRPRLCRVTLFLCLQKSLFILYARM